MSTWGDALALASAHVDGAVEALTVARDEAVTERDAALASEADARAAQAAACAERDAMAGQLAAAVEAISSANADLVLVTADRDELAAQLASLAAERDALAAQLAVLTAHPRGIPSSGVYVGAAVGGNSDPAPFESTVGPLAVRRTYYRADQVSSAVAAASADHARGRLPWISFKLPHSWADMASGAGDAWAQDLADRFAALERPVWLAFHHEPEGDGVIAEWVAMQARLSPVIHSAQNVAFTTILTGWHEVNDPSYSFDAMWPGDGLVDVVGIDPYLFLGQVKNGVMQTKYLDLDAAYFAPLSAWAAGKGVAWAVAETGITDYASELHPTWMVDMVTAVAARGGVAWAYFNSSLNSTASWVITTEAKTAQYAAARALTTRLPG